MPPKNNKKRPKDDSNHKPETKPIIVVKAANAFRDKQAKAKILVIGDSGSGKTFLAAGSKNPLIILTEANGAVSAVHSNKDALIITCTTANDLRNILMQVQSGSLKDSDGIEHMFDTLVIDSLTEVQRLIKTEILEAKGEDNPEFRIQDWGRLADRMRRLIRWIRDVPAHVVCTCLSEVTTGGDDVRYVGPMFEGKKTGNEVMQFFSAVGFLYRTRAKNPEDVAIRKLMFDGPENYMCKPCFGLESVITNPNMEEIIDRVITSINIETETVEKENESQSE